MEYLSDDNRQEYYLAKKSRSVSRKTYIRGKLEGKFWGELDLEKSEIFTHEIFYDFKIYEAVIEIGQGDISKYEEGPFTFEADAILPKTLLPQTLPCIVKDNRIDDTYDIVLNEPQVRNVEFDRKHQQNDGNEVFGLIRAEITGYIIDEVVEEYFEKIFIEGDDTYIGDDDATVNKTKTKTRIPTGRVEFKNSYKRIEYYNSDYLTTYWGNWYYYKNIKEEDSIGCFSILSWLLLIIFSVSFFIAILPIFIYILPFILIPFFFRFLSSSYSFPILRILTGLIVLFGFISLLLNLSNRSSNRLEPETIVNTPEETEISEIKPEFDSANQLIDSVLFFYRNWYDYKGNNFSGKYWIKRSDLIAANNHKDLLDDRMPYDIMLRDLEQNDKNSLQGVFQLFDSIQKTNDLNTREFAEVIVCFVQDIPYALVLPYNCDPNLYHDKFISSYLTSPQAQCAGNEKFGINSPVEFMSTQMGDCDTRALLLHSLLSHYRYDVVVLGSDMYGHAVIGINLNYPGTAYNYRGTRYVLWETTQTDIQPGVIQKEMTNMNYWKVELKSN